MPASDSGPDTVMERLDDLQLAIGEVEAVDFLATEFFDRADWSGADYLLVERVAYLLGMISKGATASIAALLRLHGALADSRAARAGDQWDDAPPVPPAPGHVPIGARIAPHVPAPRPRMPGEPWSDEVTYTGEE